MIMSSINSMLSVPESSTAPVGLEDPASPAGVGSGPEYNDLIRHPLSRESYLSLLCDVPVVALAH